MRRTLRSCRAEFFFSEGDELGAVHVEVMERKRPQVALAGRPQQPAFHVLARPGARILRNSHKFNSTIEYSFLITK